MSISVQNMAIRMWTGKLVQSTSYMVTNIPYTPKIRPNATITKPSLPRGGKPEGDYAKATGKDTRGIERQNEAVNVLVENGYRTNNA